MSGRHNRHVDSGRARCACGPLRQVCRRVIAQSPRVLARIPSLPLVTERGKLEEAGSRLLPQETIAEDMLHGSRHP